MKNTKVTQVAQNVVKEEIRKGNLMKGNDILAMMPDIIDTVHIDYDMLRSSIENCLHSKNPLNSLLNLFGVQFIIKEKTIYELMNSDSEASHNKSWLTLDEEEAKRVAENLACKLSEFENEANAAYENEKKRSNDLFNKNEALRKECNSLNRTLDTTEKMISERIQYILSLNGENAEENEQLYELLKDMNIDVYWSCKDTDFSDNDMFTEYHINNVPEVSLKPCLTRKGSIYIKGTRIVKE